MNLSLTDGLIPSGYNVECSVVGYKGKHVFQSAGTAFAVALPWLASALGHARGAGTLTAGDRREVGPVPACRR